MGSQYVPGPRAIDFTRPLPDPPPVRSSRCEKETSSRFLPDGPVPAHIDADAFAILAGNLIDNAFQHATAGTTVHVTLTPDAALRIENAAPVLTADQLAGLTRRFDQGGPNRTGFGLGLHIADRIATQSGGTLTLKSSTKDGFDTFHAVFQAAVSAS